MPASPGSASIRVALVGVGNCASALVQGLHACRGRDPEGVVGLKHPRIGPYVPADIEVVAAFDVDERKVGRDLRDAVFAPPNCAVSLAPDLPATGIIVRRGPVLDGVAPHMREHPAARSFVVADGPDPDASEVTRALVESRAEVLVLYLPVGSDRAARFYAECALAAGLGLVNAIPVFLAGDPALAARFAAAGRAIVGDDVKSQLGATITHRVLADLFRSRGVRVERTYQLNTGGNTDFLNMLDRERLASKKRSKTEAVTSVLRGDMNPDDVHVGPSDYVPWLRDRKVCFLRIEGSGFGGAPIELELRLSVEDSPNSAGVVVDAIRCVRLAHDRGIGGVLAAPSAAFCKRPPRQLRDDEAHVALEAFLRGDRAAPPT